MRPLAALVATALLASCDNGAPHVAPSSPAAAAANAAAPAGPARPAPVAMASPSAPAASCAGAEEAVFSCELDNGKRVAVCAAQGRAQYRYGGTRPELVLDGGELAIAPYSGGGEAQIAFTNGGYRYVVFSRMVRTGFGPDGHNDPAISDGIVVLKGDQVADLQLCAGADGLPVQYDAAQRVWQDRGALFTEETARADP